MASIHGLNWPYTEIKSLEPAYVGCLGHKGHVEFRVTMSSKSSCKVYYKKEVLLFTIYPCYGDVT